MASLRSSPFDQLTFDPGKPRQNRHGAGVWASPYNSSAGSQKSTGSAAAAAGPNTRTGPSLRWRWYRDCLRYKRNLYNPLRASNGTACCFLRKHQEFHMTVLEGRVFCVVRRSELFAVFCSAGVAGRLEGRQPGWVWGGECLRRRSADWGSGSVA